MSLASGSDLGPFRIDRPIGSGGMGEVYAATDRRLQRRVAIKVLRDAAALDPAHRDRLNREARAISALQHPHICTLYDVGLSGEIDYLVLELLEGETLQARLEKGMLSLPDALRIGSEIASALAAAHQHGIVHRDLKPANVMLTRQGVKLLDFGLAKAMTVRPAQSDTVTGSAPVTAEGLTGTLPYMAPEQVQGHAVDARTDIFALGLVLSEMATGRRVFEGSNQASLIALILNHQPPALHTIVAEVPLALSQVVQGCLEKDPDERWQSAHDVRRQLDGIRMHPTKTSSVVAPRARWTRLLPWAALATGIVLAGSAWFAPRPSQAPPARRLHMEVNLGQAQLESLDVPELSPDGTRLAYTARRGASRHLFVHDLRTHQVAALHGTTDASFPFWSPNGEQVAFFAQGALRRIAASGGAPQTIAAAPQGSGGTWVGDTLLFAGTRTDYLLRMVGGQAVPVRPASGAEATRQAGFVLPSLLPDGDHYLTVSLGIGTQRGQYFGSLREGWLHHLADLSVLWVRYSSGHVLYPQEERLIAREFDLGTATFTGRERTLAERAGAFSTLPDGTIAYRESEPRRSLTWVDRKGASQSSLGDPAHYTGLTLAPSGARAAVWLADANGNVDLWEVDTTTAILSRLTSSDGQDTDGVWSPDERHLAFTSNRSGQFGVYLKDSATGRESLMHVGQAPMTVDGWTPDGKFVIARTMGREVFVLPATGGTAPRMVADTPYVEDETHVSPDGRWIAFNSDESGMQEIYVAAFPSWTSKRQVSRGGGVQPLWRGDGRELFYLAPDGAMMSVAIDTSNAFSAAAPQRLFATNTEPRYQVPQYAVTADGQRFLLLDRGPSRPDVVHVLLNWLSPSAR
jgi:Tol biopolymer transport system component